MKSYYIYILASGKNGTIYIGITNNLTRRFFEHKTKRVEGFTKRYKITRLVYYEETGDVNVALNREKQLKQWRRQWKINLIESVNPLWEDLAIKHQLIESNGNLPGP